MLTDRRNFDNSELQAWKSAVGLKNMLTRLNILYTNKVYLLAHSMGNVVAGEALRLAGTNQLVNTYVASQGAIAAHAYDDSLPDRVFTANNVKTPNIYKNWFSGNNGGGAGRVINFYNTNDFALQNNRWEYDQELKPDDALTVFPGIYNFFGSPFNGQPKYTSGSVDDTSPWLYFGKDTISGRAYFNMNNLDNRYEVSAYAAQGRSRALGRTVGAHNVAVNVDLSTLWPPDTDPRFQNSPYAEHFYHSAQFRGAYWQQQGYWSELLDSDVFNLK